MARKIKHNESVHSKLTRSQCYVEVRGGLKSSTGRYRL